MASGTYPAKIDPSTSSPGHMHRELRHASFDVSKGTFIETVQLMHKDNAIYCFISCYIYADTKNQEHVAPKQSRSGRSTAKKIMNSQPIYAANFSSPSHRVSFTSLLNPFTSCLNLITRPSVVLPGFGFTVTWFALSVSGTTTPFTLTSPVVTCTAFLTCTWQKTCWTVVYDRTSSRGNII